MAFSQYQSTLPAHRVQADAVGPLPAAGSGVVASHRGVGDTESIRGTVEEVAVFVYAEPDVGLVHAVIVGVGV